MRFIVVVYDPNERTWYAPAVEAPGPEEALAAADESYCCCVSVCALDEGDLEHMLKAVRHGKPDITR